MIKTYSVCTVADEDIFRKMCEKIEQTIPGLNKESLLEDVDGSMFQRYTSDDQVLTVKNSYEVDAVYIETDIDLDYYFPEKKG